MSSRIEMKKRLFLDGIYILRDEAPIDEAHECSFLIHAYTAYPELPGFDAAAMIAEKTLDLVCLQLVTLISLKSA